eukprot:6697487-Prymnesium_polylepis.2
MCTVTDTRQTRCRTGATRVQASPFWNVLINFTPHRDCLHVEPLSTRKHFVAQASRASFKTGGRDSQRTAAFPV